MGLEAEVYRFQPTSAIMAAVSSMPLSGMPMASGHFSRHIKPLNNLSNNMVSPLTPRPSYALKKVATISNISRRHSTGVRVIRTSKRYAVARRILKEEAKPEAAWETSLSKLSLKAQGAANFDTCAAWNRPRGQISKPSSPPRPVRRELSNTGRRRTLPVLPTQQAAPIVQARAPSPVPMAVDEAEPAVLEDNGELVAALEHYTETMADAWDEEELELARISSGISRVAAQRPRPSVRPALFQGHDQQVMVVDSRPASRSASPATFAPAGRRVFLGSPTSAFAPLSASPVTRMGDGAFAAPVALSSVPSTTPPSVPVAQPASVQVVMQSSVAERLETHGVDAMFKPLNI